MPGRRMRKHFVQLSQFEKGPIFVMKTATGGRAMLLTRSIVRKELSDHMLGAVDMRRSTHSYPHSKYNALGDAANDSRVTLIAGRETLTGPCYADDILRLHVVPFLNGLPEATLQQDKTHPYTA
ncbi:hypothetical protein TNCV_4289101 [Trichonephila clavipes]|nr:hypothetical protein TNCV_4289101 [Trichonephila clavipes]